MPKVQSANGLIKPRMLALLLFLSLTLITTARRTHRNRSRYPMRGRVYLRCIPKVCRKCDAYLNSRMKRSLPDDVSEDVINEELSTEEAAFDPGNWKEFAKNGYDVSESPSVDEVNSKVGHLSSALRWAAGKSPADVTDDAMRKFELPQKRVHVVKRSANRSLKRKYVIKCLTRLRTRCCRSYISAPYIGFRI
uniref:Uncharacterized protein n=1 Tax=Ciona savignyi TaxID=51511 RepID=H2YQR2_CIOSA